MVVNIVRTQYTSHIDAGAEMVSETDSRPRQCSTASELQIGHDMARAIYSARLVIFIHGITSAKRMREVRPAVLVRESSTQLLMYSLDTCIRYSTYSPISNLRKALWRP
jgi:hypothetical protein